MSLDELEKGLRGCSVVLEIESISHLTTHSCFLVNDTFLLSYREAESIYRRSQAASTFAGKASAVLERFTGWLLQAIYRCCFAGTSTKMPTQSQLEVPSDGK